MMTSRIVLCTATNHTYAMGAAVALCSALRRLPMGSSEPLAYVLDGGLRESDWRKLCKSVTMANSRAKLIRLRPEMARFEGLPQDWGSSVMTYARLALPELVDEARILYLDADMIVQDNLAPFMNQDLEGKTIAAARDVITRTISGDHLPNEALGLNPAADYFQAGFLVIDLERWKAERVSERVLAYLRDYPEHTRYWDQSALNATLYGRWLRLADAWNTPAFWADVNKDGTTLEDSILHFVGPDKAWLRGHHQKPSALRFFDELDRTAWQGWRPSLWRDQLKFMKYNIHKLVIK
ncbi:MAG: glycosyltransferase family 8 protein [Puniceicoccaceae bacterium]|nr:MAG: glycosyltransferase family 8 protein [Puniceicoccaceae bacterium]